MKIEEVYEETFHFICSPTVAVRSCICIFNIMCNNQGLSLGIKSKCLILDPLHFSVNSAFLNFLVFLFGDT